MQLGRDGNDIIYPIPMDAIKAPKYRKDTLECVCQLDYDASNGSSVVKITEEEYRNYPKCQLSTDKMEIQADGTDKATLTVNLPANKSGETVELVNTNTGNKENLILDFKTSDSNGQVTFELTSTESGKIYRLIARSNLYSASDKVLIKVT